MGIAKVGKLILKYIVMLTETEIRNGLLAKSSGREGARS